MRYRPFTRSGLSISAITLVLDDAPITGADRLRLVYAAMEAGVNGFELATLNPDVALALGQAVSQVGRDVVILTLRLRPGDEGVLAAQDLAAEVNQTLDRVGINRWDAVVVDDLQAGSPPPAALSALYDMRRDGRARMIGVAGVDEAVDAAIADGEFDLLTTRFDMRAGWKERNRLKAATQRGMTVVAEGFDDAPAVEGEPVAGLQRLTRWLRRPDRRAADAYDFLHQTSNWTAHEIGLAFALTEPTLASVRVKVRSVERLDRLAKAVERELPNGVAAQIEMARLGTARTPLSA